MRYVVWNQPYEVATGRLHCARDEFYRFKDATYATSARSEESQRSNGQPYPKQPASRVFTTSQKFEC